MKQCTGCREYKDKREFYNATSTEDKLNRYCKVCCKVNRALESVRRRDRKSKISFRQQYRATQLGIKCDSSITLATLYRRDHGTCLLCGEWVKPRHASIDHTIPLSKGGTHTWPNVQLTHLICNLRKGNRESRSGG